MLYSQGLATYNPALMSDDSRIQRLPVEVEPFRLVEQGRLFDGRIPLNDFKRVNELLFEPSTEDLKGHQTLVNVHLEFTYTDTRLPVIKGKISSDLKMTCQRCLEAKDEPLDISFEVVLVSSDEQAERLQEGYDTWLVEDQTLLIKQFLEDEILLAIPFVVTHEDCKPERDLIEALPEDIEKQISQEKDNPFAVLKDLKLDANLK